MTSQHPARFLCGGLTTFDLAYFVDELPSHGRKGTATASYVDVGGPVANAAVTAVALGSEAEVHSVFGAGPFAVQVRDLLSGYGVRAVDHEPGIDLPVASVWVDGAGERTILSTDNRRSEVRARAELVDLNGVAAVLLDGHYPGLQVALAGLAVAADVPIVLDGGRWRPVFSELLPAATDLIMTATFRPPGMDHLPVAEAVVAIRDKYGLEVCAASRGPAPVLVAGQASVDEVPVPAVDVVDTTGAGDVMHGAYLHYRYGEGLDADDALRRAAVIASASCRARGARNLTDSE